jgi:hypothetical protein
MAIQAGGAANQLKVNHIQAGLEEIRVGAKGDAAAQIQIPTLRLADGNFNHLDRAFTAGSVFLEKGHIDVVRQADGQINVVQLFTPPKGNLDRQQAETDSGLNRRQKDAEVRSPGRIVGNGHDTVVFFNDPIGCGQAQA